MNQTHKKRQKLSSKKYYLHFFQSENPQGFSFYDFNKIDKIKQSSVSSIFIFDLLEYISYTDSLSTIQKIIDKLSDGGTLYLQGTDLKNLCLLMLNNQIDSNIFRSIMFGKHKKNILSISDIKKILESCTDITITQIKFFNALQYYIECKKNNE